MVFGLSLTVFVAVPEFRELITLGAAIALLFITITASLCGRSAPLRGRPLVLTPRRRPPPFRKCIAHRLCPPGLRGDHRVAGLLPDTHRFIRRTGTTLRPRQSRKSPAGEAPGAPARKTANRAGIRFGDGPPSHRARPGATDAQCWEGPGALRTTETVAPDGPVITGSYSRPCEHERAETRIHAPCSRRRAASATRCRAASFNASQPSSCLR
jgi:hypothetical protein